MCITDDMHKLKFFLKRIRDGALHLFSQPGMVAILGLDKEILPTRLRAYAHMLMPESEQATDAIRPV